MAVSNDEGSCLLREFNRNSLRWQQVIVLRGDSLAEYEEVMGPQDSYTFGPINIIGGDPGTGEFYETVGSLRDIADTMRFHGNADEAYDVEPAKTPEEWANAYHEERERREELSKGTIWSANQ